MPDVFLSYSREDQATAKRVAEALGREGLGVWWDQTLRSGEAYDEVTEQALKTAKAVVVLWSRTSVASRWVRAEATIADRAGTLMPMMIEACERPVMFELRQSADLSGWQGNTSDPRWKTFVDDIRAFIGRTPVSRHEASVRDLAPAKNAMASSHWRTIAIGALALLLIGAGAWALLHGRGSNETKPAAAAAASAETAKTEASVAVLPFDDMSPNKDQGYFADGIAEEILNSLARIKDLQVSGRTSSFTFKGKNEDLKVIGEKLGVANILEGSVRKDGDRIRVTAQLNKAANGFHLWSKTYDRPKGDVFAIQEDIARSVAEALQIRLGVGELGHIFGMTRDPDAYDALLESMSGSLTSDRAGNEKRIERLEYTVERDPSFAFAWLILSDVYVSQAQLGGGDRQEIEEWLGRSRSAEQNVQKLLPDSPIAKAIPTVRAYRRGEWTEAARSMKQMRMTTQELGLPASFGPPQMAERFLVMVDRSSEAITGLRRLKARDPLDPGVALYLAEAHADSGDLDAAIEEQDRGLKLNVAVAQATIAANALMTAKAKGDPALIEARWKQVLAVSGDPMGLYPLRNKPAEALAVLRRVAKEQPGVLSTSRLALWAAYFGDKELALQALRSEKLDERRVVTALAMWRPVMRDMRRLPGFKDLVREMGLVDYWREFGWGDHCKSTTGDEFECS